MTGVWAMRDESHDPKETAVSFAGVALVAEALNCPIIKMDIRTERLPDGHLCTSGVYATGGAPLYDAEAAPPAQRATLEELNRAIRARVAARLGLAGEIAHWMYKGASDPETVLTNSAEKVTKV